MKSPSCFFTSVLTGTHKWCLPSWLQLLTIQVNPDIFPFLPGSHPCRLLPLNSSYSILCLRFRAGFVSSLLPFYFFCSERISSDSVEQPPSLPYGALLWDGILAFTPFFLGYDVKLSTKVMKL